MTVAAERSVLSIVLRDPDYYERAEALIGKNAFSDLSLDLIFETCGKFSDSGKLWTWESIADAIKNIEKRPQDLAYPITYLGELVSIEVSPESLESFSVQIQERTLRQSIVKELDEVKRSVSDPSKTVSELHIAVTKVEDLFEGSAVADMRDVDSTTVWPELKGDLIKIANTPFVGSGYDCIDRHLAWGFSPGMISLIAGRPSMGKSTLRTNIMYNMTNAGIYTITISKEQRIAAEYFRLIAIETGIPVSDITRVGQWDQLDIDISKITDTIKRFGNNWDHRIIKPIGMFYLRDIKRVVLDSRKKGYDPKIVFIDLFDQLDDFTGVKQSELAHTIYRKLNTCATMADELGVHLCLVCQLKRLGKERDKVDIREMFKDSGGYEQRADLAFAVERPAYYKPDELEDNCIKVRIVKQRDGPTCTIELDFNCQSLKITDPQIERERDQILKSGEYSGGLK